MMDVIEHLADPVDALRAAAGLVAEGGTLVVLTPRYGGWLLAEQGSAYPHFNLDHVHYFTADTLHAAITRAVGQAVVAIAGVLDCVAAAGITPDEGFLSKYRSERDSMIATVRPG